VLGLGATAVLDLTSIAMFLIGTVFAVGFWTVIDCVLGAIGAAIGGRKEEKRNNYSKNLLPIFYFLFP